MREAHGHSLWFVPHGSEAARLSLIIRKLSEAHQTPCFPPHVTLLARVPQTTAEVLELTRRLARGLSPFEIALAQPATTDEYFRALFIKAFPSEALMEAHERARACFGITSQHYMPHLSLVYGDLSQVEKDAIIAELGRDFSARIAAHAIDVYHTEGRPEAWRLIDSVPLLA